VWEGYVRRCEGCLGHKCLPWETLCQRCFREENPGQKYHGLVAASLQARKRLTWPVKSGKALNEIMAPVGQKSVAPQGNVAVEPTKFHSRLSESL
jgi:hypothetical protein